MRKILGFVGAAAAVVAISTMDASATCSPNKTAATFGNGGYAYISAPADVNTDAGALVGRWWQAGGRAASNEGASGNAADWFYFTAAGGNINNQLGTYDNVGCPTGQLITTVEAPSLDGTRAYFAALTVDEVSGPAVDFAYENVAGMQMVAIPRPRVTSSSRVAPSVNLNIAIDAVNGGAAGPGASSAIAGYQLVTSTGPATAPNGSPDAGRGGNWTALGGVVSAAGGGPATTTASVDCSDISLDRYVAVRVVYRDGVQSDLVGGSTRVKCNPALADPDKGFKVIDRKGSKSPTRQ